MQPILLLLCATAVAQSPKSVPDSSSLSSNSRSEAHLINSIRQDISFIKDNVFSFWQKHGLDSEFGGFHGTLDRSGAAVDTTNKGLIQQTRHIWAFSTYHQAGFTSGSPSAQRMAQSAHDFVVKHMQDPSGLWYKQVTRQGQKAGGVGSLYAQWFVLYGFSQFSQVFGKPAAKELALSTFKAADAKWHDSDTGGYEEDGKRTLNALMHGTEALTALHKATGDSTVLSRLLELVGIICTRLGRTNGLIHEEYNPASGSAGWTPASGTILYGHNMEVAWLISETLDYLQSISAISSSSASNYRSTVMSFGATAAKSGFDQKHGGVFESPSSTAKIWWVQAESMLGFWKLHQYFGVEVTNAEGDKTTGGGDKGGPSYLQMLADTATFVREHQTDNEVAGEQFWQVNADGSWGLTGDKDKDTKGNRWKAAYHSSRAPLFLERWM